MAQIYCRIELTNISTQWCQSKQMDIMLTPVNWQHPYAPLDWTNDIHQNRIQVNIVFLHMFKLAANIALTEWHLRLFQFKSGMDLNSQWQFLRKFQGFISLSSFVEFVQQNHILLCKTTESQILNPTPHTHTSQAHASQVLPNIYLTGLIIFTGLQCNTGKYMMI